MDNIGRAYAQSIERKLWKRESAISTTVAFNVLTVVVLIEASMYG